MMVDIFIVLVLLFIALFIRSFIRFIHLIWQTIRVNVKSVNLKQQFGEWAVVTGSTDGIGKEYAKELAKKDINIVLISRSLNKLTATKNEISALNSSIQVKIIEADFSKGKDEIEKIDNELKDIPIGILVNNVGKLTECPMYFGETPRAELWDMININIGATTLMTHLVIEKMKKRKKGAIVNVCSFVDRNPFPLFSFYSASKTFVHYFSDGIRIEYEKHGITVQTLSPCFVNTKMVAWCRAIQGHRILFPDAATYARNAVKTLGKLNSTTGYWIHDILYYFAMTVPAWVRTRCSYIHAGLERNAYLKSREKKNSV